MRQIVVEAWIDETGALHVRPVSDKHARKYRAIVRGNGGSNDLTAYFQDWQGEDFVKENIPRRHHSMLKMGYSVRWKADPWVVGHWYGFDAHCAEIS